MTGATVAVGTTLRAPERAVAIVRDSWRRLTLRDFGLAMVAGIALGGMQALGHLVWDRNEGPWWVIVGGALQHVLLQAILLLLALAVAVNVEAARLPKWWPFAVAATVATAIAGLFDFGLRYAVGSIELQEGIMYVWALGPYMLLIAALAAFGTMHAADAARRTGTLRNLQLEQVRVAREAYQARLVALQARVEPRFLFETLSDVEVFYEKDAELGARVLDDLIAYLRAALPALEDTSSTLDAELMLVRTWLDIMRIRAAERLWFALPEAQTRFDARMPPMLLLPLVQHAVDGANDAARTVFVSVTIADERVRITVVGPAAAFARFGEAPAIAAIRERLQAIYAEQSRLVLEATRHDRSQAILEIPYERTDRRPR